MKYGRRETRQALSGEIRIANENCMLELRAVDDANQ